MRAAPAPRAALLGAALAAVTACGGDAPPTITLDVVLDASVATRPTRVEGQWLDGERGLVRFEVTKLRSEGALLASIGIRLRPGASGGRRVVVVGRAGGEAMDAVVAEGFAVFDIAEAAGRGAVTLVAARAADGDRDGVPDPIDACPGDDFAGCAPATQPPRDGGPDGDGGQDASPDGAEDAGPDVAAPASDTPPEARPMDAAPDAPPVDQRPPPPPVDLRPATPPAAAPVLTARVVSGTHVELAWTDTNGDETGFALERALDAAPFAKLADPPATAATFADMTVIPLRRYRYRITAVNAAGGSPPSNVVAIDTPAVKLSGVPFGTKGLTPESDFRKALDGDTTTYFLGPVSEQDIANAGFRAPARQVVTRIRFHPRPGAPGALVGGRFEGSNESSISGFETIFTIPGPPAAPPAEGWNEVVLPARSRPYTWLRYLTAPTASANIAELELWGGPE